MCTSAQFEFFERLSFPSSSFAFVPSAFFTFGNKQSVRYRVYHDIYSKVLCYLSFALILTAKQSSFSLLLAIKNGLLSIMLTLWLPEDLSNNLNFTFVGPFMGRSLDCVSNKVYNSLNEVLKSHLRSWEFKTVILNFVNWRLVSFSSFFIIPHLASMYIATGI